MKARVIIATVLASLVMCLSCQAQESKKESSMPSITKEQFLSTIWNYEEHPENWDFKGKRPCIIDFYADWCGPCRKLSPILEEIAQEYNGKIDIYKVNVDNEGELASAFGITSIPTLLFCPMEGAPQIARGLMTKEELKQAIKEVLNR